MTGQRSLFELLVQPDQGPETAPAEELRSLPTDRSTLLDDLKETALTCSRCHLSRSRTNVVFGEGNPDAPLVLIGEGPGDNEDRTGRPFVGRAGKLLDELLGRCRMTREHVYITNIIKCRTVDLETGALANRAPAPDEIRACNPWLEEQIAILKPDVIICVGSPSAQTVIRKGFRITQERGLWFENVPYAPWAMAILHPAYLMRLHGPSYEAAIEMTLGDIERARQKVIELRKARREQGCG